MVTNEHEVIVNDALHLRSKGWVLNKFAGKLSVKYGPTDDTRVVLGQYENIPDRHKNWRFLWCLPGRHVSSHR